MVTSCIVFCFESVNITNTLQTKNTHLTNYYAPHRDSQKADTIEGKKSTRGVDA